MIEAPRDAEIKVVQLPSIQRSHFTSRNGLSNFGRARTAVLSAVIALAVSSPVASMELIQCPDWKSFLPKQDPIVLRKTPSTKSFEESVSLAIDASEKSAPKAASKHPSASSAKPTLPKPAGGCETYTIRAGDTLERIARRKLGDGQRYRELYEANKDRIKSVRALRDGTVITIPCEASEEQQKATPWWARKSETTKTVSKQPVKPETEITERPSKPQPKWTAKKGEYLSDVLKRWGKKAGYTVIVDGPAEWKLGVRFSETGSFEEIIQELVKGFARDGIPPSVRVHSNKVIKVGASL